MARLPRVKQKIFAGTASADQITEFGTIKSGTPVYTSDAADIMNSNFESGWGSAIEGDYAPYRQDRNAVDTAVTQQLAYLFQEGVAEWDSNTTYYNGSVAKLIDGTTVKLYRSIADNNTSTLNDTTKWVLFLNISNTGVISSPTIDNPTMTGTVNMPTPSTSDSSTKGATTAYVQNNLTGAISTVKTSNLTASRAVISNSSGKIAVSATTSTELGYVHGVTSAIQTQLDNLSTAITTAITNCKNALFPVGSLYSTIGNTNPNSLLGFGTWSLVTSSIVTGSSNPTVWGDGTHALGLEYYDKTNSVSKYGTMQQSAEHDYSNGTNTDTTLGIATKTTNNNLNDNYNNIGGQSYNGYHTGYGANVISKGNGTSGLYADLSDITTTIYIWKRTA